MKKENFLEVLEQNLEDRLTNADFAMDWDKKKHTVEVTVALYAENKDQEAIEDGEGIVSEEEVIEFQDSLLFYMADKPTSFDADEYLAVFPFEKKKGLSEAFIVTFSDYLDEVTTQGMDNLLAFLEDETQDVFELVWETATFEQRLAQAEATVMYPYPSY